VSYNEPFQFRSVDQVNSGQLSEFPGTAGETGRHYENAPRSRFNCDPAMKGLDFWPRYLVGRVVALALDEIPSPKNYTPIDGNDIDAAVCRPPSAASREFRN
jgi:hypothetical protein